MNDRRQLPASSRPGLNVGSGSGTLDGDSDAQGILTLAQFLRQGQHIFVGENRRFQVEQTGAGVTNLLAKVPTRPEDTQATTIMKLTRGHYALLCDRHRANPTPPVPAKSIRIIP
jgi:hypothetical protein